ncbi:MAG TPA: hypothetical protein PKD64_19250 [Pirellulaceae bacterium]|nr:hypothetical protein [Pirellulaceae bacterium]HMO94328.1 hypothetical protein [Pirellulaceae bacterium]HMP71610.1 hypothetical protein [Pirellulaceae bacterium]
MNLNLPQSIEHSLRQQAAAVGMDVEQFAIYTLQKGLANTIASPPDTKLARDVWEKKFARLLARFPARQAESRVDCSRDTIYDDADQ